MALRITRTAALAAIAVLGASACSASARHTASVSTTTRAPTTTSTTPPTSGARPATTRPASTTIAPGPKPTLGQLTGTYAHGAGFGQVAPSSFSNGGDPTGAVSSITWSGWGDTQAIGNGQSDYVGPGQAVAAGSEEPVRVVAFRLGQCSGHYMYQAVEWFFPEHGGTFDPMVYEDICDGSYVNGYELSTTGQVGALQMDTSNLSAVEAFEGTPEETASGSVGLPHIPPFSALGYSCSAHGSGQKVNGVPCVTVFYIDVNTGKLGGFHTQNPKYRTAAGSTVGMSEADVARNEGVSPHQGCDTGITLGVSPQTPAQIQIDFTGGTSGTATTIVMSAVRDNVGLLNC